MGQLLGKIVWGFPYELTKELPCELTILLQGIYPQRTHTHIFTEALFTTATRWKQPQSPSTGEWINKLWSVHATGYYAATERSKVLIQDATWGSEN